jgi:hypothetical protein
MQSYYQPLRPMLEGECLEFLQREFVRGDEQREIWLDSMLDQIERRVKDLGGQNFGRLQAAMLLYRMIELGYYPSNDRQRWMERFSNYWTYVIKKVKESNL